MKYQNFIFMETIQKVEIMKNINLKLTMTNLK